MTDFCALYRFGADFQGTCKKAIYLGQDKPNTCPGKVIYGSMKDGFGVYGFYLEGVGNIYFMGPDKSKPNLKNNLHLLTRVEVLDAKGKTSRKAAKGQCTMIQDLKRLTAIECRASIAEGNLDFSFTSNIAADSKIVKKRKEDLSTPGKKVANSAVPGSGQAQPEIYRIMSC